MIDEGVVKYDCRWTRSEAMASELVEQLNEYRDRLYAQNLIGQYPDGIGFGNLSILHPANPQEFIITATQTGHLDQLTPQHYTTVTSWDLAANQVACQGPAQASSESLTHATLYQADPSIQAIIHVHDYPLWAYLMDEVPTTKRETPYGTPEMALEMERLLRETDLPQQKILVMAGHEEGIITFGKDLADAYAVLMAAADGSPDEVKS